MFGLDLLALVIVIVLLLIFISLPLKITAGMLDEDPSLSKALIATILLIISFFGVLALIPGCFGLMLAIFVNLLFIKVIYDTDWGKSFAMWLVAIIMAVVILVIMGLLLGATILAVGL